MEAGRGGDAVAEELESIQWTERGRGDWVRFACEDERGGGSVFEGLDELRFGIVGREFDFRELDDPVDVVRSETVR